MDYINKNANKTLFIFLAIVVVIIVALVVFYSLNFKSINKQYDQKIKALNDTYNSLVLYQNVLNKTKSELQVKTEREQGLSTQYTDVKTERDSLQTERDKLKDDNTILQTTLTEKNDELSSLTTKFVALNRTYYTQRDEIDKLTSRLSSCNCTGV